MYNSQCLGLSLGFITADFAIFFAETQLPGLGQKTAYRPQKVNYDMKSAIKTSYPPKRLQILLLICENETRTQTSA